MIRLVLLLALLAPGVARGEGRGFVSTTVFASQGGSGDRVDSGALFESRLEGKVRLGIATAEINVLAFHAAATLPPDGREVERSSALAATPRSDGATLARGGIDRALVEIGAGPVTLIAGRQPVNLATCFFFTPNDLFAPFAATAYYRVYKPGVDAARLEWGAGDFTQGTLLHVLGYAPDPTAPTGWGDAVDGDRSSTLGRVSTLVADTVDAALLGGAVARDKILGAALQGDLLAGFGFRAEGHYRWRDGGEGVAEVALQLNRRFASSLDLTLEGFHHGGGADAVEGYDPQSPLPARRYAALGASYEWTPLLTGSGSVVANLTDGSMGATLYALYSVADEAEADLRVSFPLADSGPAGQYGGGGASFAVSFRSSF